MQGKEKKNDIAALQNIAVLQRQSVLFSLHLLIDITSASLMGYFSFLQLSMFICHVFLHSLSLQMWTQSQ